MNLFKISVFIFFSALTCLPFAAPRAAQSQAVSEAPTGFDARTNGLVNQATFERDRLAFETRDAIADGLGPVYNAQSCVECHQSPHAGGSSQITVLRAGRVDRFGSFIEPLGGSLIQDRAIHPSIQERLTPEDNVRAFRIALSTLGDGFVEAIADETLEAIAAGQPASMRGEVVYVPVLEAGGALRVGRFGWKNQHASLLSFAGEAYLNEQGITNRLFPHENTSLGRTVAAFDTVADPEDVENEIDAFARFIRATKAPPRDLAAAALPEAQAGAQLFEKIGCAICHVPAIVTAPPGTPINGGTFIVPVALGNKVIRPYSDFLLHDVGTGDGIYQTGSLQARNKLRTPPLWGLHTRLRYMHDGATLTLEDAILRHGGEAAGVTARYRALGRKKKANLIAFLNSL